MSESNWRRHVATGLAFCAFLTVAIGVATYNYWLGHLSGYKEAETNRYQAEYAADTDQRIARCFEGSEPSRECVEKAIASNHEQQRNEADLQAQREMADWAFWMLVVSTVGLGVTAIGTVFLAWQVRLTHEAVTDTGEATAAMQKANEIAESAQRPWLTLDFEAHWVELQDRAITLNGAFVVQNIGGIQAEHIAIDYETHVFSGDEGGRWRTFWAKHVHNEGCKPVEGRSLLPQEEFKQNTMLSASLRRDWEQLAYRITPVATVRYTAPGGRRWHVTERSFEIWLRVPGIRTEEGEFFHGTSPGIALRVYESDDIRVTKREAGRTT